MRSKSDIPVVSVPTWSDTSFASPIWHPEQEDNEESGVSILYLLRKEKKKKKKNSSTFCHYHSCD